MNGGRFSPRQAYVAFSRVKTLHGLHILNFNAKGIKCSGDVENEMARLSDKLQCLSLTNSYVTICLLTI